MQNRTADVIMERSTSKTRVAKARCHDPRGKSGLRWAMVRTGEQKKKKKKKKAQKQQGLGVKCSSLRPAC